MSVRGRGSSRHNLYSLQQQPHEASNRRPMRNVSHWNNLLLHARQERGPFFDLNTGVFHVKYMSQEYFHNMSMEEVERMRLEEEHQRKNNSKDKQQKPLIHTKSLTETEQLDSPSAVQPSKIRFVYNQPISTLSTMDKNNSPSSSTITTTTTAAAENSPINESPIYCRQCDREFSMFESIPTDNEHDISSYICPSCRITK